MSVILEDRPIQKVREEVIDQLILNYSHGVISSEAFERRLDSAMASESHHEIVELVADLEMVVDTHYNQHKESQFSHNYGENSADTTETIVNVFGGSTRTGKWSVPREIKVLSLFGGSKIDFSDAIFSSPNVTIKVLCIFGGDDIFVPENINVVSKAFCVFGGIDNKAPSIAHHQAPTLTIEGLVVFGGVNISIKQTIKEKFVAFANQLKSVLNSAR